MNQRRGKRGAAVASEAGGTKLSDFPRPSLAVDVVLLTVAPFPSAGEEAESRATLGLGVLLLRRSGQTQTGMWGLPGSFVRERERLSDAVLRTLREKCDIEGLSPRQLHVFDDPKRDDRGWVISVAHLDAVPADALRPAFDAHEELSLAMVQPPTANGPTKNGDAPLQLPGRQRRLPFDHDAMVNLAVHDLRERYRTTPDPAGLLPEPFTLLELRRVHEALMGESLQKDTFRRQMTPQLQALEERSDGTVGRPARLFTRCSSMPSTRRSTLEAG